MLNTWAYQAMAISLQTPADPYGPELWPQPLFDASAGLTLTRCSVGSGLLTTQALGSASICATSGALPITLTNGMTFHYEIDVTASDMASAGDVLLLRIGGTQTSIYNNDGLAVVTGTAATTAANQTIELRTSSGDAIVSVTSCSIKQIL